MIAVCQKSPSIPGRRGGTSVADAIVHAVQNDGHGLRINELALRCSEELGYEVKTSTIRSVLYRHAEMFEKSSGVGKKAVYRLTSNYIRGQHEE